MLAFAQCHSPYAAQANRIASKPTPISCLAPGTNPVAVWLAGGGNFEIASAGKPDGYGSGALVSVPLPRNPRSPCQWHTGHGR